MNSPFLLSQARAAAKRTKGDARAQARQLSRWILAREPDETELKEFAAYLGTDTHAEQVEPEIAQARTAWDYGTGKLSKTGRTSFIALPHFADNSYRGGAAYPDPKLDWVSLGPTGGHPSDKVNAVRRWTAPRNLHIRISGSVRVPDAKSDGVRALAVSSRFGIFEDKVIPSGEAVKFEVGERHVKAGEHIDFVVNKHKNIGYDSFHWAPVIKAKEGGIWNADKDFAAPDEPNTARLAQILLCSNEFLFID